MSGLACPRCRRSLDTARDSCPGCGRDVSALRQVADLADRHFNQGLRAARAGSWPEAGEGLAVTLALRPDDLEATALAARVARRQGRTARARELAARVAVLDPGRTDLAKIGDLAEIGDLGRTDPGRTDAGREDTGTGEAAAPARPPAADLGLVGGLSSLARVARDRWGRRRG